MAVEVAEAYVSLVPSARGFGRKLGDEIGDGADTAGRDAGDRAGRGFAGAFVKHLAVGGAIAAGLGAVVAGKFIAGAIQSATDLNETISKSNTIFGESAGEIESWASTAATSLGQSKQQALGAAAQFGNMFKQLGLGTPQAAAMSKQMVELATDFASFHNADITDVLEAQSAAFRGEYDSVQRFVPTITAAAVEQKALALGLAGSTKELDAQDKALATQALLMEGAGAAVGDFARTSAGLANQQRIMGAQWDNLKTVIGQAFIPVATQAATVITSKLMPALLDFAREAGPKVAEKLSGLITLLSKEVPKAVEEFAAAFKTGMTENDVPTKIETLALKIRDLVDKIKELVDLVVRHKDLFTGLVAGLVSFAGALTAVKIAAPALSIVASSLSALPLLISPLGLATLALGGLAAAAVFAYKNFGPFKDAVDGVAKAFQAGGFKAAVDEAGVQFERLWPVVKVKIDEFISAAGEFLRTHGPDILRGLRDAWLTGAEFVTTEFLPFMLTKLGEMLKALGGWIVGTAAPWLGDQLVVWGKAFGNWVNETALPWLSEKLPAILGAIAAWVRDVAYPAIVEKVKEWGKAFVDWIETEAIPKLKEKLPGIIDAIRDWVTGTLLPALGEMAKNMAIEFLKFAAETVIRMPGELAKIVFALGVWAVETTLAIPGMVKDIGIAIIEGIIQGALEKLTDLLNWFRELPDKVISLVKGGFGISSPSSVFMGIGGDIIQGLLDGVTGAIGAVMDFFLGLPADVVGWVGDAYQWLVGKGGDIIRGLLDGVTGAIGGVSSFFLGLPADVVGWVGDAFSWLVGKGGDVIRGFISGIESWIGSVAGHIANIGTIVRNAIGDASDWLYAKGQQIMDGLVRGIESAAGRVSSAVSRIASEAARAVPIAGQVAGLLIDHLAAGGIVTKPTFALIGEEGPEAVIPLDMFNRGVQFGKYPTFHTDMPATAAGAGPLAVNVYAQTNANPDMIARELSWTLLTRGR